MEEDTELITLKDAAAIVGVRPVTLATAARNGKLTAQKKGRDWLVTRKALHEWAKSQRHVSGRPRSKA